MTSKPIRVATVASAVLMFWAASIPRTSAQAQADLRDRVDISIADEDSTFDPVNNLWRSTATLKLTNDGDRIVEPPFHAVVNFEGAATLDGLVVEGGSGGPGQPPHDAFFLDLDTVVGAGLAPGASVTVPFAFTRPPTLRVRFDVSPFGVVNGDPVADAGGPYRGAVDEAIAFEAGASTDPEGQPLSFAWDFGDGSTANVEAPSHAYGAPGVYQAAVTVTDDAGFSSRSEVTVLVVPEGDFALGRTRTLDGVGHPLGGVEVMEAAPGGDRILTSGAKSGFTTLGGGARLHRWKF